MMLDKKILEIVKNDEIPYKWLVTYGDTHILDLQKEKLEGIFPDLYRWTKIAFQQNKSNAFNLLYNLLWIDEKVNVLNWEYSGLEHYKKRLAARFKTERATSPSTIQRFLIGEKLELNCLHSNLTKGVIVFMKHANKGDDTIYCSSKVTSADISKNDQDELMDILMERVTDKLKYVDFLLSDEGERNIVFAFLESYTDPHLDKIKGNTPLAELLDAPTNYINKQSDSINDSQLDIESKAEEEQIGQSFVEENEGGSARLQKAIEGDELLKMFLYLNQNVTLTLRSNANPEVIKYSAIYFALQDEIQDQIRLNKNSDWFIHKKQLAETLGIELKTSKQSTGPIHIQKVRNILRSYK